MEAPEVCNWCYKNWCGPEFCAAHCSDEERLGIPVEVAKKERSGAVFATLSFLCLLCIFVIV